MAPVLTLHDGGRATTFQESPSKAAERQRRHAEAHAVGELAETAKTLVEPLPSESKVRKDMLRWSASLTKWAAIEREV